MLNSQHDTSFLYLIEKVKNKNKKMIKYIIFLFDLFFYVVLDCFLILVKIYMNWYGHKRLRERGKDMANSCLHILSKKEYTATRCQDGILLFWPIEGSMYFQQFMKERILTDELYIVNNMVSVTMASH